MVTMNTDVTGMIETDGLENVGAARNVNGNKARTPPRISDVARLAGVSTATVSMVMNNNPRISRATSKRVRATAERLGYRPNRAAQALRGIQTRTLVAFVPVSDHGLADLYVGELLNGVRETANNLGYRLLLETGMPTFDSDHPRYGRFDAKEVDGIMCIGCTVADVPHDLLDLPLLLVDSRPSRSRIDHVSCDYRGGMRQAVNYLIELGHRNIALLRPATPDHRGPELLSAYREAMGAGASALLLAETAPSEQGGSDAIGELLDRNPAITAVITADDRMAAGVLHRMKLRGLSCPGDLSVVSLGDTGPAEFTSPGVTAIRLPLRAVGAVACEKMIQRLRGEISAVGELLPTQMVLRGSTGMVK